MYIPRHTKRFEKDIKRMRKRGKNMQKVVEIMGKLGAGGKLALKYRDHGLVGEYIKHRECHIEPDWLLIYRIHNSEYIYFERTGTHADLFNK